MKRIAERVIYSPSDLVRFIQSPYVAWMERAYLDRPVGLEPDPDDAQREMLSRKGDDHEHSCIESFRRQGIEPVIIGGERAFDDTRSALAARAPLICQAALSDGVFEGYADFLVLRDGPSARGEPNYVILDAKLARHVRPHFLVQLCCYADMLGQQSGARPEQIGVLLGDGTEQLFRVDDFFYYYRHLRNEFLLLMDRFPDGPAPEPDPLGELGRWRSHAEAWVKQRDHLSQVANITRGQIRKLEAVGVDTLCCLATTGLTHIRGMEPATVKRLKHQAMLQVESRRRGEPVWEWLDGQPGQASGVVHLPPADQGDVFFDIEGYPLAEGGLEYLFGAVTLFGGSPSFHDWWAHDSQQEKHALEAFVDWLVARRQTHPGLHVFHYGHYETTALKRLMGKYGTREDAVDNLLRGNVFVDLYRVVTQSVRIGEPGYSLKNLERLWMDGRAGDVATAGDSIVYYDAWIESGQPANWQESPLLDAIRKYNEEDCISTWKLAEWLRQAQPAGVSSTATDRAVDLVPPADSTPSKQNSERNAQRAALAEEMLEAADADGMSPEDGHLMRMLGWLVGFHRRETKPVWWRYFDRLERSEEELIDDPDCLGGVRVEGVERDTRKYRLSCRFNPDQDTKLSEQSQVAIAVHGGIYVTINSLNREGRLSLSVTQRALDDSEVDSIDDIPPRFSLIPKDFFSPAPIDAAIEAAAATFLTERRIRPALRDFLLRKPPRVAGHAGGPLVDEAEDDVAAGVRIARSLDSSVLCIQGPPGAGKTYTASRIIHALLADGKNVGISSNSHKAILNLMKAVHDIGKSVAPMLKVGGGPDDPLLAACEGIDWAKSGPAGAQQYRGGLVGGTAWFFSNESMQDRLDYLFVDEAGQVSVGNLAGMSYSTTNIVVLGDQMQLGQPIQGSHPGESGMSVLEYYLAGHQTIPADKGLFLGTSWRMHPGICRFISEAVYERRLTAKAHTRNRRILVPEDAARITKEAGILFVPVEHTGNSQSSEEEVEVIAQIVDELLGRTLICDDGAPAGSLTLADHFLFVAPFNMQVRKLQKRLGADARIGSVDKFQGQEAPVVVVSLCSSDGEGSRGIDFVLDRNRLNVAVSRAQSLAIVVGSPGLGRAMPQSVESMRRLNLFHQMLHFARHE